MFSTGIAKSIEILTNFSKYIMVKVFVNFPQPLCQTISQSLIFFNSKLNDSFLMFIVILPLLDVKNITWYNYSMILGDIFCLFYP